MHYHILWMDVHKWDPYMLIRQGLLQWMWCGRNLCWMQFRLEIYGHFLVIHSNPQAVEVYNVTSVSGEQVMTSRLSTWENSQWACRIDWVCDQFTPSYITTMELFDGALIFSNVFIIRSRTLPNTHLISRLLELSWAACRPVGFHCQLSLQYYLLILFENLVLHSWLICRGICITCVMHRSSSVCRSMLNVDFQYYYRQVSKVTLWERSGLESSKIST